MQKAQIFSACGGPTRYNDKRLSIRFIKVDFGRRRRPKHFGDQSKLDLNPPCLCRNSNKGGLSQGYELIYWACDDVYRIEIEPERCNIVSDWVRNIDDNSILSVSFINWENDLENNPVDEVEYDGLRFVRKKSVTNQWQHHFWRVKVLQTMFDCLDEPKDLAKEMDYMQKEEKSRKFWDLINEGKWYMLDHNAAILGESTARGFNMLLNCAGSFYENNLKIH